MNSLSDNSGCSALNYAIEFKDVDEVSELLKKCAFIGVKNQFNRSSIGNINAKWLEEHFDDRNRNKNR